MCARAVDPEVRAQIIADALLALGFSFDWNGETLVFPGKTIRDIRAADAIRLPNGQFLKIDWNDEDPSKPWSFRRLEFDTFEEEFGKPKGECIFIEAERVGPPAPNTRPRGGVL